MDALILVDLQESYAHKSGMQPNEWNSVIEVANNLIPNFPITVATLNPVEDNTHLANAVLQQGITTVIISDTTGALENSKNTEDIFDFLQTSAVQRLFVMGLETTTSVKTIVLQALNKHYEVYLVVDGCRGVNQTYRNTENAIKQMEQAGVQLITSLDTIK